MRKGFTLIELIIVVIVIGILATVAVPQYLKATERAKLGKARNAMGLLAQGEKLFRAENDTYIAAPANGADAILGPFVELAEVDTDTDWAYDVGNISAITFTVTATRSTGGNAGEAITLTEAGVWDLTGFTP